MIIKEIKIIFVVLVLVFTSSNSFSQNKEVPVNRILFIFDASQSMLSRWQSGRKIDIAKKLLTFGYDP